MPINIETTQIPRRDTPLTWREVEAWLKRRRPLINSLSDSTDTSDRSSIDSARNLWREMQVFWRAFSSSVLDSVRFVALVDSLVTLLIPILRHEPNFNPDPRYVMSEADLTELNRIDTELIGNEAMSELPRLELNDLEAVETLARTLWDHTHKSPCRIDQEEHATLEKALGDRASEVVSGSAESMKVDLTRLWTIAQASRPPYGILMDVSRRHKAIT